jgi:hypothetical protein
LYLFLPDIFQLRKSPSETKISHVSQREAPLFFPEKIVREKYPCGTYMESLKSNEELYMSSKIQLAYINLYTLIK